MCRSGNRYDITRRRANGRPVGATIVIGLRRGRIATGARDHRRRGHRAMTVTGRRESRIVSEGHDHPAPRRDETIAIVHGDHRARHGGRIEIVRDDRRARHLGSKIVTSAEDDDRRGDDLLEGSTQGDAKRKPGS